MKSKRAKQVMAITVAAASALMVLSGCGSNSSGSDNTASDATTATAQDTSGDIPTVKVVLPSLGNTDDTDEVEEAMNEILVPEIGAKVDLTWIDFGAYTQQANLMLTGGDDIDVFFVLGTPATYISNGQVLDLTDYWNNAGDDLHGLIDDYVMEADQFNGRIYTIPEVIERSHEFCLQVNKELLAGLGLSNDDESKIWTLDEIHDLLVQAHEKYPDIYTLVPQSGSRLVEGYTWEGLGDTNFIGVVEDMGSTGKVVSITDCQDFIDLAHTFRQWYQEGLIMQDILSYTEQGGTLVENGKAFSYFEFGCQPAGLEEKKPMTPLTIVPNWIDSTCATRFGYAINANTKNADAAWKVLESMYTNDDIIKLYSYGIEGKHYVINDEGKAAYPDGVTSETSSYNPGFTAEWAYPATRACSLQPFDFPFDDHFASDQAYDQDAFDNGRVSGCLGALFDSSVVPNEYSACTAVKEKYFNAILSGAVDPDENIAAYKEELKAAGEDTVIAEKQRLVDALASAN